MAAEPAGGVSVSALISSRINEVITEYVFTNGQEPALLVVCPESLPALEHFPYPILVNRCVPVGQLWFVGGDDQTWLRHSVAIFSEHS